MGKFIQPNGRPAAPIFPQMPKVQQRMGNPQNVSERKRSVKDESTTPKEAPIMKETPTPKQTAIPEKASASKKMTVNDLRNGFKLSIIIGEPVSRKYRGYK